MVRLAWQALGPGPNDAGHRCDLGARTAAWRVRHRRHVGRRRRQRARALPAVCWPAASCASTRQCATSSTSPGARWTTRRSRRRRLRLGSRPRNDIGRLATGCARRHRAARRHQPRRRHRRRWPRRVRSPTSLRRSVTGRRSMEVVIQTGRRRPSQLRRRRDRATRLDDTRRGAGSRHRKLSARCLWRTRSPVYRRLPLVRPHHCVPPRRVHRPASRPPESYRAFITRNFTGLIDIDPANVHVPDGAAADRRSRRAPNTRR